MEGKPARRRKTCSKRSASSDSRYLRSSSIACSERPVQEPHVFQPERLRLERHSGRHLIFALRAALGCRFGRQAGEQRQEPDRETAGQSGEPSVLRIDLPLDCRDAGRVEVFRVVHVVFFRAWMVLCSNSLAAVRGVVKRSPKNAVTTGLTRQSLPIKIRPVGLPPGTRAGMTTARKAGRSWNEIPQPRIPRTIEAEDANLTKHAMVWRVALAATCAFFGTSHMSSCDEVAIAAGPTTRSWQVDPAALLPGTTGTFRRGLRQGSFDRVLRWQMARLLHGGQ